uniref:Uncharacterized protein n=1 Tax=Leersia perrieri TaxID=77586 RepID=A0A0D9X937_9ORYZ
MTPWDVRRVSELDHIIMIIPSATSRQELNKDISAVICCNNVPGRTNELLAVEEIWAAAVVKEMHGCAKGGGDGSTKRSCSTVEGIGVSGLVEEIEVPMVDD